MIAAIIKQLQSANWYGDGECIEIAKGKNEMPKTWQDAKRKIKRARYMDKAEAAIEINKFSFLKKLKAWLLKSR